MKKAGILALASVMMLSVILTAGCSKKEKEEEAATSSVVEKIPVEEAAPIEEPEEAEEETEEADSGEAKEVPEGLYLSELTGEPIDEALKDQRPVAVMVDNESIALPHYGTAEADVVYEMMNSTANDRITRLMVLVKDWGAIEQLGSIRSTRPTNVILAAEWNAVLCHDGGPFYINDYLSKANMKEHFSGTFSRVNNGKATEFTEYVVKGDLDKNFANSGYSKTYNQYKPEDDSHFNFTPWGKEVTLSDNYDVLEAKAISLPFKHNGSKLNYNAETGLYEYSEYGKVHQDAEDAEVLAFKNVILQSVDFMQLDEHGYLIYDICNAAAQGYYITNGEAIPIYWSKTALDSGDILTRYYDTDNNEIEINTGKTYIGLIPSDSWDSMTLN